MNNLNDALLMLLIRRSDKESDADVFAYMQARYDARLTDDWGPLYKIGPTFVFGDQKFSHLQTFAGSSRREPRFYSVQGWRRPAEPGRAERLKNGAVSRMTTPCSPPGSLRYW